MLVDRGWARCGVVGSTMAAAITNIWEEVTARETADPKNWTAAEALAGQISLNLRLKGL